MEIKELTKAIENIEKRRESDYLCLQKLKIDLNNKMKPTLEKILETPVDIYNEEFDDLRECLKELLTKLWIEEESFNSKRPWGDSGWRIALIYSLMQKGVIPCKETYECDGYIEVEPTEEEKEYGYLLIQKCIDKVFEQE